MRHTRLNMVAPDKGTAAPDATTTSGNELPQSHQQLDTARLPRPAQQKAARALVDALQSGDVIALDNTRYLVVSRTDEKARVLRWHNGKALEELLDLDALADNGKLRGVERKIEPALIHGRLNSEPMQAATWDRIRSGAVLFYPDGRREEILAVRPVPNRNQQNKFVDSVFYQPDGGIVCRQNELRTDRELAVFRPPLVFEKTELDPLNGGRIEALRHRLEQGPLAELFEKVEDLIRGTELVLARQAARFSDCAVSNFKQRQRLLSNGRIVHDEYEVILANLKEVHEHGRRLVLALEQQAWGAAAEAMNGNTAIADKALQTLRGFSPSGSGSQAYITEATGLLQDLSRLFAEAPLAGPDAGRALEDFKRTAAALADLLGERLSLLAPLHSITRLETTETVTPAVLAAVSRLAAGSRRDPESPTSRSNGLIIDDYYTPDYLLRMLRKGARLITNRDLNRNLERCRITGFALYFEPGKVPEDAKGIPEEFRLDKTTACFDLMCIVHEARIGTYQRLLNAATVYLQHTPAQKAVSEVLDTNHRAFKLSLKNGCVVDGRHTSRGQTADGKPTRWICIEFPVHPELRMKLLPAQYKLADGIIARFKNDAAGAPHEAPEQVRLSPEEEKIRAFASYARAASGAPVIVRISMGAGNMTAEEFAGLRTMVEKGFERVNCVVTWGSTVMLTLIDGMLSGPARGGLHESIQRIMQTASEEALFAGVTIFKPGQAREVTQNGINGGKPILILNEEVGQNYANVEDFKAPQCLRFGVEEGPGKPFWDQEAIISRQIATELGTAVNPAHGRIADPFRNVVVFGSGGGTIGREIKALAEEAYQCPNRDLHVVLMDMRNPASPGNDPARQKRPPSSTELYIDDQAFRERHTRRALETGRAPYVHVVRSGEELNALLLELGALTPPHTAPLPDLGTVEADSPYPAAEAKLSAPAR